MGTDQGPKFLCLDGNHKHLRLHTLLSIGYQDRQHTYHPLAFAMTTGKERGAEIYYVLEILHDYLKSRGLPGLDSFRSILDSCPGGREALVDMLKRL